ncbi:MAG: hypothetical protein ACT6RE_10085 [Flavobacteriales bacterium]
MNDSTKYNDEQLRRQLENYAEMPSERVWSGVAHALDQKKKKRRLLFWFLLLGGIACGSTVWFLGSNGYSGAGQTAAQNDLHTGVTPAANPAEPTQETGAASSAGNDAAPTAETASPATGNTAATGSTSAASRESSNPQFETTTAAANSAGTKPAHTHTGTPAPETASHPYNGAAASQAATNAGTGESGQVQVNSGFAPLTPGTESSAITATRLNAAVPQRSLTSALPAQKSVRPLHLAGNGAFMLPASTLKPSLLENNLREGAFFRPAIRPVYPKIAPFISLEASAGSVWYNRRAVSDPQNGLAEKNMQSRTSGLYAAGIFKGGFFFGRHGIFSAGMGYEYYGFSNPYALTYSGSPNVGTGAAPETIDAGSYESFGDINIPLPVIDYNGIQKTLNGRLHMQTHNLFFPLDLGARYNFRNFSLGITAGPAFHVLLRQNVYFRNEDGTQLPVDISQPASFNISLGVEPVLAYRIRSWSLFASGGFRYHLLSAVKDPSVRSYPYRANGQLGLRYHLR